jgi:hypothetical protein
VAKRTMYLKHVPTVGHTEIWAATEQKAQAASITEIVVGRIPRIYFGAFLR